MNKMPKPKQIIRQTLADELPAVGGVYVIAYLKTVVYVGKAESSIGHRLKTHKVSALEPRELLGRWMIYNSDWENIRIDSLLPPDGVDDKWWIKETEAALINGLSPLLNQQISRKEQNVNDNYTSY